MNTSVVVDEIQVCGCPTPVELRRHPGARRLTLRVSQTRRAVIVTVPRTCGVGEASQFVERNLDWLRERLDDLPPARPFADGAVIPLRGHDHEIVFIGNAPSDAVVKVVECDEHLPCVSACGHDGTAMGSQSLPRLCVKGLREHAPRRLKDWLINQAKCDLTRCVGWHGRNLQLKARRISIRDQSTRWGSCSSSGTLSFSWRLVLAPPFVLDYVAAHEVAHLQEMNHGPRFWDLVRMTMPRYEDAQAWLRDSGPHLHSVGLSNTAEPAAAGALLPA